MKSLLIRKSFVFIQVAVMICSLAKAQDIHKIDSLRYQVETAKSDSLRVYNLVAISKEYASGDVQNSLQFAQKALAIAEKSNQNDLLSYALFNIGVAYFNQGLLEISTKYFYRYFEIQKEMQDDKGTAYALVNLGAVHLKLNQFEQSRAYFEQALNIFDQMTEQGEIAKPGAEMISIYNNLGVVSKNCDEPEKAIDYYSRGISLARRTPGQEVFLGNLLNNLGSIYLDLGKTSEAYDFLNEAYEVRLSNDDKSGLVKSYLMFARYYLELQNVEEALNYAYLGYNLANTVGVLSSNADALELLFQVYNQKQMADSALKYYMLSTELKEKLNKDAALKELSLLEITAQFRENEKLAQIEQKRKEFRYLMIGLTLILIVAILSLLYFLSHSRNRRLMLEKVNINLNSKNLELEKESLQKELEIRNKELATNVMYQIQKNELIQDIVQKLEKHSISNVNIDHDWIVEIIRDLEKTQQKSVWNEFEVRFQQVHNEFYDKLNAINPELSPNDRRLCAFLRLNMTTKEIASITGQSIRSIEVARTRLRKRLNLTNSETGLIEFLSQL
ncbi:MAG: tetratricopeptide repeat protein [Bacteroidales bacterium]|nr:tetratricopeptide repeat protein [Bacteroidales bacterium]